MDSILYLMNHQIGEGGCFNSMPRHSEMFPITFTWNQKPWPTLLGTPHEKTEFQYINHLLLYFVQGRIHYQESHELFFVWNPVELTKSFSCWQTIISCSSCFYRSTGHRYGKSYYAKDRNSGNSDIVAPFFKADIVLAIPNVVSCHDELKDYWMMIELLRML